MASLAAMTGDENAGALGMFSAAAASIVIFVMILKKYTEEVSSARIADKYNADIIEQLKAMFEAEHQRRLETEERALQYMQNRDETLATNTELSAAVAAQEERIKALETKLGYLETELAECKDARLNQAQQ